MEKSGFYRQGLPSKPHKLCRNGWEEERDDRRHNPGERWRFNSEVGGGGGGGVREARSAAAQEAADAPARRGGGVKGHSAAAGLAGCGGGREPSAPCARVEERQQQQQRGGGSPLRPLPILRAVLGIRGLRHSLSSFSRRGGGLVG